MKRLIFILLIAGLIDCQAQTVPNTTTFCFSDVVSVVGGTCLQDAFTNSIDSHFDPTYKGSKNQLSNFRNYNNFFTSIEWCGDFQRDDCEEGIGEIGQVCVDAGYAISWVSQDDANDQADQYLYGGFGQEYANENFGCISECTFGVNAYSNTPYTLTFNDTRCICTGSGYINWTYSTTEGVGVGSYVVEVFNSSNEMIHNQPLTVTIVGTLVVQAAFQISITLTEGDWVQVSQYI